MHFDTFLDYISCPFAVIFIASSYLSVRGYIMGYLLRLMSIIFFLFYCLNFDHYALVFLSIYCAIKNIDKIYQNANFRKPYAVTKDFTVENHH